MRAIIWTVAAPLWLAACASAPKAEPAPPAFADPPAWAAEAVWYQIFVERFWNGDPDNDPTAADIDGSYPDYVPEGWETTAWTADWHAPDPYADDVLGGVDGGGYPVTLFEQTLGLRRYGGDLQGVLDRLDHLEALGVTAVYFNPVNDAPSLHKFDARHWRHVDRNFGPDPEGDAAQIALETPDDPSTWTLTSADRMFLKVIEELRARDIRVILDISWNHTGHRFWAWLDVLENQTASPYADWYWVESFDDPETEEDEFAYRGWFGVNSLPEIRETVHVDHTQRVVAFEGDILSEAVKEHIFAVARRWLDPNGDGDPSDGVDGYRLDVAAEIPLGFWREFRQVVREVNPETYLIGEVWWEEWPDKLMDPEPFLRGDIFDAVMNYRWYRSARRFLHHDMDPVPVSQFVGELEAQYANLRPQSAYAMMNMAASHDVPRLATSLFNANPYKMNAKPEQDPAYKIHRPDAETFQTVRLLLAHQFTYVGAPQIWAGDEMGMWGADDPHNRKPLIWPELTFAPERAHPLGLDRPVDEVRFDHALFADYQRLVAIRTSHPVLSHGDIEFVRVDDAARVLAYSRFDDDAEVLAVLNAADVDREVTVPLKMNRPYADVLAGLPVEQAGAEARLTLPARSAAILVAQ